MGCYLISIHISLGPELPLIPLSCPQIATCYPCHLVCHVLLPDIPGYPLNVPLRCPGLWIRSYIDWIQIQPSLRTSRISELDHSVMKMFKLSYKRFSIRNCCLVHFLAVLSHNFQVFFLLVYFRHIFVPRIRYRIRDLGNKTGSGSRQKHRIQPSADPKTWVCHTNSTQLPFSFP